MAHGPVSLEAYLNRYGDCIDLFEEAGIGYSLTFPAHSNIGLIGDGQGSLSCEAITGRACTGIPVPIPAASARPSR